MEIDGQMLHELLMAIQRAQEYTDFRLGYAQTYGEYSGLDLCKIEEEKELYARLCDEIEKKYDEEMK